MTTEPATRAQAPERDLQVRADLVQGIYWHIPRSSLGVLAGAGTVAWGMWGQVPHATLLGWVGAICAILLWRGALYRAYKSCEQPVADAGRWERLWTISTGLHGTVWGSSAFFMYVGHSPEYQALLLIALFAICTAAVPLVARHRPSLYAFVIPTLVPITARLAFEGSAAQALLSVFSVLVMYGIFLFGNELNRTIRESVKRRYENLDLIKQLTAETARAEAARGEADHANRMKSRFLAAASHDLRQPMHALVLFSASLRRKVVAPDTLAIVDHVCQSVQALEQMFDALIDLSRLEAGGVQAVPQAFALQPLFERLHRDSAPDAAEKGLKLRFVRTHAVVMSDPVLVERILRNLLTNAIRYTARGGVVVGCRRRASSVSVEVCDTGPGVPAEIRERIFEEFFQGIDPNDDRRKGLGLGLATVRRLANLLHAPITLRTRIDRGSVFSFTLPRAPAADIVHAPPARPAEEGSRLSGAIILVIDDDPGALEAMRDVLAGWGARPVTARSLDEALATLSECERYPDAIVSDYRLGSGENGVQAIDRIRDELGLDLPALVVTGDTANARLSEIESAGHVCLAKPVAADRLRASVAALLRGDVTARPKPSGLPAT